jgi:hypothetical protein
MSIGGPQPLDKAHLPANVCGLLEAGAFTTLLRGERFVGGLRGWLEKITRLIGQINYIPPFTSAPIR